MKTWQNSVYAPNRGGKKHSKKSHKRRKGHSLALANKGGKRRKGRKSRKHTAKRNTGRTLASYNKKRKHSSHKRRGPSPGAIVLHNKGEMIALKPMIVAGLGGAGIGGLLIFLGEKYVNPKMPASLNADQKSAVLGGLVAVVGGVGAAKIKNKNAKLAFAGASVVGIAYALNALFGSKVKQSLGLSGAFVQPPMGSVQLTTTTARVLGGMTVTPSALPAPGATQGTSVDRLYANRVW